MDVPKATEFADDTQFSVYYKFSGNFTPIEHWLTQNCSGKFAFSIEAESRIPGQMTDVILRFELEMDRTKFRDMVLEERQQPINNET